MKFAQTLEQQAIAAESKARMQGPVLVMEGRVGIYWQPLAIQRFGDAPAKLTNNHASGRDVFVTQVHADRGTISRLPSGIDDEAEAVKHAILLHSLRPGQTIELMVRPDNAPTSKMVRYRYEAKLL